MEKDKKASNLLKVSLLTGAAFIIGGFFRTGLELALGQENFFMIFMAIWLGFLGEAVLGIAVLAWLLRSVYPFRKLWLAGVSAFAAGILIPALLINQFFFALLILPGFLTGLFYSRFLDESSGKTGLILSITLGFLICQVLFFSVRNDMTWVLWLYSHAGANSVKVLMDIAMNMVIGVSVAVGVGMMVRRLDQRHH